MHTFLHIQDVGKKIKYMQNYFSDSFQELKVQKVSPYVNLWKFIASQTIKNMNKRQRPLKIFFIQL